MLRNFQQHRVRPTAPLQGLWRFATVGAGAARKPPRRYDRVIHVPSAWETTPGLEAYRGHAWAAADVEAMEGRALRVVFGGVSHTAEVFVDGKRRGRHYDAFTPWDVVVPGLDAGPHELAVSIDNTFGAHSALHIENDYYTYGGITRPVEAQHVPEAWVRRAWATPRKGRRGWSLDVRVWLSNWSDRDARRGVTVTLGGAVYDLGGVVVPAGGTAEVRGTLEDLDVEPWSHESPRLYELAVELYDGPEVVDDLIDRVGFRVVEVRGRKLLLNGQPIRLRGYNRHEDHGNFGCAIPLEAMAQDLQILADLGCNFVRTSHYPNDQRFLDLCDEMGFYVWEESHARAVDMNHPKFVEQIDASTREMIEWHHNHASVIIWGFLNEHESQEPAQKHHYERLVKLIKAADPSRPVTFASHRGTGDLCHGLVDIVSVNRYVGWYGADLPDVERSLKGFLKWLNSDESHGGKNKPVILSEFGAGAIPGYHAPHRAHWTEEYQSDVLDEELRVYLNHPQVVGAAVWQFCDVRVTPGWWNRRPRTMNNKGTVDQFRRAKQCYAVVKRRMLEAKAKWGR